VSSVTATTTTTTKFEAFIASLRSEATRITYESAIKKVLGDDPDSFLSLDQAKAKDLLVGYIIANRDKFTGATIANRISNGYEISSPKDAAWGERFFHVNDPDGHELSMARRL
jgi:uncharacterized glyoxalase superfamily protein PhnB